MDLGRVRICEKSVCYLCHPWSFVQTKLVPESVSSSYPALLVEICVGSTRGMTCKSLHSLFESSLNCTVTNQEVSECLGRDAGSKSIDIVMQFTHAYNQHPDDPLKIRFDSI
eukprot:scaffold898_cov168-Amphora_coffeaeformis.AAC.3